MLRCMTTWCGVIEHPGVQGEASRLLAWIIKNCGADAEVVQKLVDEGCLIPIIIMMGSEHPVMVCIFYLFNFFSYQRFKPFFFLHETSLPVYLLLLGLLTIQ